MSEKQGTGIPKILRELSKNGSSKPLFDTDEDRVYLETTILCRDGFEEKSKMSESMSESMSELERERMQIVLQYLSKNEFINSSIAAKILDVEVKTASRLLSKAEKISLLNSKGKTKDKIYALIK